MPVKDITKMIMNPVRLRIIQYLMLHDTGTVTQIKQELCDVPQASLYRHIKLLEEVNLILVVKENKIRGTVEKTYQLNKEADVLKVKEDQGLHLINSSLLTIMGEFNRYLSNKDNDPQKDMLFLSTSALLLSDEEFTEFTTKLGAVFQEVINNKTSKDRKVRRITFISSPNEEKKS